MRELEVSQTRMRVLLLGIQVLVLLLSIFYIGHYYTHFIGPDHAIADNAQTTPCTILSKKLTSGGFIRTRYRPDFLISYQIENVPYYRWASANGLDRTIRDSLQEATTLLSSYAINGQYTCYYNPARPDKAVLTLRRNWLDTFPLMLPLVIVLIVLYYLFLNLAALLSLIFERPL